MYDYHRLLGYVKAVFSVKMSVALKRQFQTKHNTNMWAAILLPPQATIDGGVSIYEKRRKASFSTANCILKYSICCDVEYSNSTSICVYIANNIMV